MGTTSAHRLAWQAFRLATAALARRHGGLPAVPGLPDWLDPAAINALWLPLQGGLPMLGIGVRDGVPLAALPARLALPGWPEALPLRCVPFERARVQGVPGLRPAIAPTMQGTATALLHDLRSSQRLLLTCGHVAAPTLAAAAGQDVRIDHADVSGSGQLRAWQPSLASGALRTTIDAALIRIDEDQFRALRTDASLLPAGLSEEPQPGQRITLRRRSGPLEGRLLVHWSGPVDVPGLTPDVADYFLDDAIGYRASMNTVGGDSGSAIWDEQSRLMGMHIAGLPAAGPSEANAIYGPIRPVLDWFKVTPWLRSGVTNAPHTVTGARAPTRSATPAAEGSSMQPVEVVAATIWGEARNQGETGMRAVGCVIANRYRARYRLRKSPAEVCLDPWQFSCWNAKDPNLPRMRRIATEPDRAYATARAIAEEVLADSIRDITEHARHYYSVTLRTPPTWARGKKPCKVIGDHLFFNNID